MYENNFNVKQNLIFQTQNRLIQNYSDNLTLLF